MKKTSGGFRNGQFLGGLLVFGLTVSPMLVYDGEPIAAFGPANVTVANFRSVDW